MQPDMGACAPVDFPVYHLVESEDGAPFFDAVDPAPNPQEALEELQMMVAVDRFKASLTEFERRVVDGVYYRNLSQAHVAAELAVNTMAVSRALAEVRRKGANRLKAFAPTGFVQ